MCAKHFLVEGKIQESLHTQELCNCSQVHTHLHIHTHTHSFLWSFLSPLFPLAFRSSHLSHTSLSTYSPSAGSLCSPASPISNGHRSLHLFLLFTVVYPLNSLQMGLRFSSFLQVRATRAVCEFYPSTGAGQSGAYAIGLAGLAAELASVSVSQGSTQLGPGTAQKHHLASAGRHHGTITRTGS